MSRQDLRVFLADLFSVRTLIALIVGAFAAGGVYHAVRSEIAAVNKLSHDHHNIAMGAIATAERQAAAALESSRRERNLQIENIAHRVIALEAGQRSASEMLQLFAALKVEVANLNSTSLELKQEIRSLRAR